MKSYLDKLIEDANNARERAKANVHLLLALSINCPECGSRRPLHKSKCHLRWAEDELREES